MTSVDLGEFYAEQSRAGLACPVTKALTQLPPDDAAKLRAALAEPGLQSTAITRWLAKHGMSIYKEAVSRHRRGDCRCPKT